MGLSLCVFGVDVGGDATSRNGWRRWTRAFASLVGDWADGGGGDGGGGEAGEGELGTANGRREVGWVRQRRLVMVVRGREGSYIQGVQGVYTGCFARVFLLCCSFSRFCKQVPRFSSRFRNLVPSTSTMSTSFRCSLPSYREKAKTSLPSYRREGRWRFVRGFAPLDLCCLAFPPTALPKSIAPSPRPPMASPAPPSLLDLERQLHQNSAGSSPLVADATAHSHGYEQHHSEAHLAETAVVWDERLRTWRSQEEEEREEQEEEGEQASSGSTLTGGQAPTRTVSVSVDEKALQRHQEAKKQGWGRKKGGKKGEEGFVVPERVPTRLTLDGREGREVIWLEFMEGDPENPFNVRFPSSSCSLYLLLTDPTRSYALLSTFPSVRCRRFELVPSPFSSCENSGANARSGRPPSSPVCSPSYGPTPLPRTLSAVFSPSPSPRACS